MYTKRQRLASLSNKDMVQFWKETDLGFFSTKADYQYSEFTEPIFKGLFLCNTKALVNNMLICLPQNYRWVAKVSTPSKMLNKGEIIIDRI